MRNRLEERVQCGTIMCTGWKLKCTGSTATAVPLLGPHLQQFHARKDWGRVFTTSSPCIFVSPACSAQRTKPARVTRNDSSSVSMRASTAVCIAASSASA